jgi:hypothetical protein
MQAERVHTVMIQLDQALRVWGTPQFKAVLAQELARAADQLPLQQGLSSGNYVSADPVSVMITSVAEIGAVIRVRAGIFYQGVLGGCSCADDPSPASDSHEYCEVQLEIDRTTAATAVVLVA